MECSCGPMIFSTVLVAVCVLLPFVACQGSCKSSEDGSTSVVTITQSNPFSNTNNNVMLNCTVKATELGGARPRYSWSISDEPVKCVENNVYAQTCTFKPANLSLPVKCQAVYNNTFGSFNCTIYTGPSSVLSASAAKVQPAVLQSTTKSNGGGTAAFLAPSTLFCFVTVATGLLLYT